MTIQRLLVLGGTGAVGQAVLQQALADEEVKQVVAPTRRALPAHPKLCNPVPDFSQLPLRHDAATPALQDVFRCDAVICALGSTMKAAGSKAAFTAIDKDLVLQLASLARQAGAQRFALNSSLGASVKGNFYLRTKAAVETGVLDLGFERTVIVRPSLIDADRQGQRLMEHAGVLAARALRPLIPSRYRAVTPEAIARSLILGVKTTDPGQVIVESEAIR